MARNLDKTYRAGCELAFILLFGVVVFIVASWNDMLEYLIDLSRQHENWNIDEILVVSVYLTFALLLFSLRRLKESQEAKEKLLAQKEELEQALKRIRVLEEIIPICAWCKQIRDDEGYWHQLESYMHSQAGTIFTHGMCPNCENQWREEAKMQLKPLEGQLSSTNPESTKLKESGRLERGFDDFD